MNLLTTKWLSGWLVLAKITGNNSLWHSIWMVPVDVHNVQLGSIESKRRASNLKTSKWYDYVLKERTIIQILWARTAEIVQPTNYATQIKSYPDCSKSTLLHFFWAQGILHSEDSRAFQTVVLTAIDLRRSLWAVQKQATPPQCTNEALDLVWRIGVASKG